MSLTLGAELASAQDSQSRRPLIELITGQIAQDIPFDGQRLTSGTSDETKPNMVVHSSGRLIVLYRTASTTYFVYTDEGRNEFTYVSLGVVAQEACPVELADGNIGIIYSTSTNLYYMVVTPTGTVVTSSTSITSFASNSVTSPFVIRLSSGDFLLVYAYFDDPNYKIMKLTSSNFTSWTGPTEITPSGLTSTKRIDHTSLLQISTDEIWLWFDYLEAVSGDNELVNIYYSTSSNDGSTWSAATQFTTYSTYGTSGKHPIALQNVAGQMLLMYYEQTGALHMDDGDDGFCSMGLMPYSYVTDLSMDTANRKLYCTCTVPVGIKYLICVFRVDMDTWTIDACWNDTSSPTFNDYINSGHEGSSPHVWWHRHQGDQHLIPVASTLSSEPTVDLLDGDADTITHYYFVDIPEHSITKNVTFTDHSPGDDPTIVFTKVDHTANKLWVGYQVGSFWGGYWLVVGYFDLTETGGTKTFVDVVAEEIGNASVYQLECMGQTSGGWPNMEIYPDDDLILLTGSWDFDGVTYKGWLRLYNISTGASVKYYKWDWNPEFPYHGLREAVYKDGKIYGGFHYDTIYSEGDKRGLCVITVATDTFQFFSPPWATADDYGIRTIEFTDDDRLIVGCWGYGIAFFDLTSNLWGETLFNNDSIPGLIGGYPPPDYCPMGIVWDTTTNMVYFGNAGYTASWSGLAGFHESGKIKQTKYQVGTYSGTWSWTDPDDLVTGLQDYDAVGGYADDALYSFWENEDLDTELNSIMWDFEAALLNLSDYIVREKEISVEWTIDGSPNRLSFSVSHGHLFDSHNLSSLLKDYLKKGRRIAVRMGELIDDVEQWVNQGQFFVTETKMSYERGPYPVMDVVAEDRRCFWEFKDVLATEYFSTDPYEILTDILVDELDMLAEDIILPDPFDNSVTLYCQWIETPGKDIVEQICHRFGYVPKFDVNGDFGVIRITDAASVDHTYTDSTKMIQFTPDDSYSDFTNQVVVTGTERTEVQVTYNEERLGQVSGTIGWWGCENEYYIYYSLDHSRKCTNPRLVILQSVSSIGFQMMGQIHESITYEDPDYTYCIITVTAPNLIPLLIALIAAHIALYWVGDIVVAWGGGFTIPFGSLLRAITFTAILMVLGAVGNFSYEVWGRPLGLVRRSIQAVANDEDHQAEIETIVLRKYEESLACTMTELQVVADQELLVAKLQRKRVTFSKVADLRDEIGDTIIIKHPHSNQDMKIFVTKIIRKMKISESSGGQGYFTDYFEAWNLTTQ